MTTDTQSESAAKKDTQKLQRAIVDGLEDVKAQDVVVFNTEHLSPLFERVIVASGTSNRQTKALAASVRDAVREAGFPKPRIEGEDNGEWIIVDCGAAVAHIMQPAIRQYYHLEEIWGDKPVRLKFGASKPAQAEAEKPAKVQSRNSKKKAVDDGPSLRRSSAAKTAVKAAEQVAREEKAATARKPSARGAASRAANATRGKAPAKAPSKAPAQKTPGKMLVVNAPAKKPAAKKAAAKAPVRKPASRKA
ncbi:MAG: ribosome silencing factor [Pseudomonadota bacterium]